MNGAVVLSLLAFATFCAVLGYAWWLRRNRKYDEFTGEVDPEP